MTFAGYKKTYKNIFITFFLFIPYFAIAQTGIGTKTPQSTLDIVSKPADLLAVDGVLPPRLTGNELKSKDNLYGNNQNGTLVFATSPASPTTPKTIEVVKSGYYYYDATAAKWLAFKSSADIQTTTNLITNPINTITSTVNGISSTANAVNSVSNTSADNSLTTTVNGVTGASVNLVKSVSNGVSESNFLTTTVNGISGTPVAIKNIYNSDGTLTNERSVTMAGNRLFFRGTMGFTRFSNSVSGAATMNSTDVGTSSFMARAGTSDVEMYVDPNAAAQIGASGTSTALSLGTTSTTIAAPITFFTSTGGGASGQDRAEIAGNGKFNIMQTLSVGYSAQQNFTGSQKLKVNGSIVTTSNTYPDYVFEKYFTGKSAVNPKYDFKKLGEIKTFIQENHHLPGIISIKDIQKTNNEYDVDLTKLTISQLEKIEELYLHVIEQEDLIKKQQGQIQRLTIRLKNIEKKL